jgi:hypothetical protein
LFGIRPPDRDKILASGTRSNPSRNRTQSSTCGGDSLKAAYYFNEIPGFPRGTVVAMAIA